MGVSFLVGEVAASVFLTGTTNVTSWYFLTQLLLFTLGITTGVTIPLNAL